MTMEMKDGTLHCADTLSVEDAESLQALLLEHPGAALDLAACLHVHGASLQVLAAARRPVLAWPAHEPLALWLQSILT